MASLLKKEGGAVGAYYHLNNLSTCGSGPTGRGRENIVGNEGEWPLFIFQWTTRGLHRPNPGTIHARHAPSHPRDPPALLFHATHPHPLGFIGINALCAFSFSVRRSLCRVLKYAPPAARVKAPQPTVSPPRSCTVCNTESLSGFNLQGCSLKYPCA